MYFLIFYIVSAIILYFLIRFGDSNSRHDIFDIIIIIMPIVNCIGILVLSYFILANFDIKWRTDKFAQWFFGEK